MVTNERVTTKHALSRTVCHNNCTFLPLADFTSRTQLLESLSLRKPLQLHVSYYGNLLGLSVLIGHTFIHSSIPLLQALKYYPLLSRQNSFAYNSGSWKTRQRFKYKTVVTRLTMLVFPEEKCSPFLAKKPKTPVRFELFRSYGYYRKCIGRASFYWVHWRKRLTLNSRATFCRC